MSTSPQSGLDQRAQEILAKVRLDHFTAEPLTIDPFARSKLSWKVTAPEEFATSGDLAINHTYVAPSGELLVAPESTTTYRLDAQIFDQSKVLGSVTVHVGSAACVALSAEPVDVITSVIKFNINTDDSGTYFRPTSVPIVIIQDDRMVVRLRLAHKVDWFPDPSIDIDAGFALDVVPVPPSGRNRFLVGISPFQHEFHQLAPARENITVDVSFPWYAWLVPGAMIALPIVISGIEQKSQAKATTMVDDIVAALNGWFHQAYVQPPKMDKHDAGFYVNPQGSQRFWTTFCPVPTMTNAP